VPFSLILDILIAVLLVASIGYSVSLNRRLTALRQDRDELAKLTVQFADATDKAEASIQVLKGSTDEIASALNVEIAKAESMRDDLTFLVDRGANIADKLESGVRTARESGALDSGPKEAAARNNGLTRDDDLGGSPFDDPEPRQRSKKPPKRVQDPSEEGPDARAKAQQELLKALQSMS